MVCKDCLEALDDFLDGTLKDNAKAELDEHFKDCPPCLAFLNTYQKSTSLCKKAMQDIEVPDEVYEHIKAHLIENIKKKCGP